MKTNLFTLTILSATLFLYSCDMHDHHVVPGSNITTAQATFSDYNGIDASTAFSVYINFSDDEESIEIEANDNLHQHIEVKKQNGILLIGIEDNVHVRGNATLNAYITTKDLSSFSASGASRIIVEDLIDKNNVNGYPSPEIITRLEELNSLVYQTTLHGTISLFISEDGTFITQTEKEPYFIS